MAKAKTQKEKNLAGIVDALFTLPELSRALVSIPIIGTADLWPNPMTPWAQAAILDAMVADESGSAKVKPKKRDLPPREPEKERSYLLHLLPATDTRLAKKPREEWTVAQLQQHLGFPCSGFKGAMTETAKTLPGVTGKDVARLMYVAYDPQSAADAHLVRLTGTIRPRFAMTYVGPNNKRVPMPLWGYAIEPGWRATLEIKFFKDLADWRDIVRLVSYAGQLVGVGSNRPSGKNSSGECGTWEVDTKGIKVSDLAEVAA